MTQLTDLQSAFDKLSGRIETLIPFLVTKDDMGKLIAEAFEKHVATDHKSSGLSKKQIAALVTAATVVSGALATFLSNFVM